MYVLSFLTAKRVWCLSGGTVVDPTKQYMQMDYIDFYDVIFYSVHQRQKGSLYVHFLC